MDIQKQIETVKSIVAAYYVQNAIYCKISGLNAEEQNHIINIGTSILCTKWGVGYEGGSFVQSFVNNDLLGAIGRADETSYKGFKFFAALMYNVGMPSELNK
jgi:hypothetical protein